MKAFTKILVLSVCIIVLSACFVSTASAQGRDRVVVKSTSSQPTNLPPAAEKIQSEPAVHQPLTNNIIVVAPSVDAASLVKRTVSSRALNAPKLAAGRKSAYSVSTSTRLDQAIKSRYGIPYRYGSTGPNTYDCSGFVWSSFQEAGIFFTRASARSLWSQSEPVEGDDRFKFGTLVFFNNLGHMGIVADENGFYQASSSKGITYSPFAGYWESRIVGFRKLKAGVAAPAPETVEPDDDGDR